MLTTMKEMGLIAPASAAPKATLQAQSGNGTRIAILGAGLAGMTAAYELEKAGYDCVVLEGRDRASGHCQTIRGGDVVTELENEQVCGFDKVAFQSKRRFWEEDSNIYGGISLTEKDITQIWYPSTEFQSDQGVLVGAYIWDNPIGNVWGTLSPEQRLAKAIEEGAAIHPNYAAELSPADGITIAWEKIPYSLGGWAEWEDEQRETAYKTLLQPDGPIYLAGGHLSYLTGWQEGSVRSALIAVEAISSRAQAA